MKTLATYGPYFDCTYSGPQMLDWSIVQTVLYQEDQNRWVRYAVRLAGWKWNLTGWKESP